LSFLVHWFLFVGELRADNWLIYLSGRLLEFACADCVLQMSRFLNLHVR